MGSVQGPSVQGDVVGALRRLIAGRQRVVARLDAGSLCLQRGLQQSLFGLDQIGDGKTVPEGVLPAVAAGFKPEDLLQDLQVVRNGEGVT